MQQIHYDIKILPRNLRMPYADRSQPPPANNKFLVSVILNRLVDKYYADDDHVEHDDSIAIANFEFEPNDVLSEFTASQILSSMRIPLDHQPQIVFEIISLARAMIGNQNYNNPCLTVLIVMGIMLSDDGVVDEAEARAMEGSMDMFRRVPATRSSIEALEKIRLPDDSSSTERCMVCLEELNSTVEVTRMPCSHIYHGDCIVRWLETSHLCPVCRFEMPT